MDELRTTEERRIADLIKKAIRSLNKTKGTAFKIAGISFGLGVDDKYGSSDVLDAMVSLVVQDTVSKKIMRLFWYESFFDPDLPDDRDAASGADRIGEPEGKVLLRIAYCVWTNRH